MYLTEFFTSKAASSLVAVHAARSSSIPALSVSWFLGAQNQTWPFRVSRFLCKALYEIGIGCAFNRYSGTLSFYSSNRDKNLYHQISAGRKPLLLNIGSGGFYHPFWRLFDYPGESGYYKGVQGVPGKDFEPVDLCVVPLRLPVVDSSVRAIYVSHTLEHLPYSKALAFLKECSRALVNGGVLRLALPRTSFDFYRASIICEAEFIDPLFKQQFAKQVAFHVFSPCISSLPDDHDFVSDMRATMYSAAKFVDIMKTSYNVSDSFNPCEPGWHLSEWNGSHLSQITNEIGMSLYMPVFRGQSYCPVFSNTHVFDTTEPQITFYGEFIK